MELDLSELDIPTSIAKIPSLMHFSKLKLLCLDGQCITREVVKSSGLLTLKGLTSLSLSGCKLSKSVVLSVCDMSGLTTLDLSQCDGLDQGKLNSLTQLTNLEVLWLNDTDILPRNLPTGLTHLHLANCNDPLVDDAMATLSSLTALRMLDISNCRRLTDQGLQSIGSNASLEIMCISECTRISEAGVIALAAALPRLKQVFCDDLPQVSDDVLDIFQRRLNDDSFLPEFVPFNHW
jgi:F-box/leucine-rich repeat protein 14